MEANETVLEFIKNNANTNKAAISEATGVKGLPLFNILKKLQTEEKITSQGEGPDMTFTSSDDIQPENKVMNLQVPSEEIRNENKDELIQSEKAIVDLQVPNEQANKENPENKGEQKNEETPAKVSSTRNKDKYIFNAEEYGKGPLVRTIVAQYMTDHPTTTFKQLKEKFADSMMKRFGVFEEVAKAKELSGNRDRYFFKPEQLIKTADKKTIAVCSQWTASLIIPFLEAARKLGYDIK
jgi:hypothetical protein